MWIPDDLYYSFSNKKVWTDRKDCIIYDFIWVVSSTPAVTGILSAEDAEKELSWNDIRPLGHCLASTRCSVASV